MLTLSGNDLVGIYLLLKENESALDTRMNNVLIRIEKCLFENLSIQEFEQLDILYSQDKNILKG